MLFYGILGMFVIDIKSSVYNIYITIDSVYVKQMISEQFEINLCELYKMCDRLYVDVRQFVLKLDW